MDRPSYQDLSKRLELSERRRKHILKVFVRPSASEDNGLWSLVDLMTLLLLFFILLYTKVETSASVAASGPISMPVKPEYRSELQGPSRFEPQSQAIGASPAEPAPMADRLAEPPQPNEFPSPAAEEPERELKCKIDEFFTADEEARGFTVRWHKKQPIFVLDEKITFHVGRAELLPNFTDTLQRIARFVAAQAEQQIVVSGHTDDAPIKNSRFPSNWELSACRAAGVARFLINNGVSANRITIQGYARFRPLVANSSSENKRTNRRVEVSLVEKKS